MTHCESLDGLGWTRFAWRGSSDEGCCGYTAPEADKRRSQRRLLRLVNDVKGFVGRGGGTGSSNEDLIQSTTLDDCCGQSPLHRKRSVGRWRASHPTEPRLSTRLRRPSSALDPSTAAQRSSCASTSRPRRRLSASNEASANQGSLIGALGAAPAAPHLGRLNFRAQLRLSCASTRGAGTPPYAAAAGGGGRDPNSLIRITYHAH